MAAAETREIMVFEKGTQILGKEIMVHKMKKLKLIS